MYQINRNNYHKNPKPSNIQTPLKVSQFIFELLRDKINKKQRILDPCSGMGNLTAPWKAKGYQAFEIDSDKNSTAFWKKDFLQADSELFVTPKGMELQAQEYFEIGLVLCNPPFNGYGNKLGSEVWLDKIIELFGKEIPIVLFVPMGFRLNSKKSGKRWNKFINDKYPPIASIISLPRDIFPAVEFHCEILIFNIKGLESHYFYKPNE